ncbi:hypothetical protein [Streptomyces synnematoformans]
MTTAVLVSAGGLTARLLPRLPPRALIVPGMLLISSGMLWILTMETDTSYVEGVLVAGLLLGVGAGMIMPVAFNYATHGIDQGDAGVASASLNATQQVGSSTGTALLNTIASSATADYLASHASQGRSPAVARQAALEGFETAGTWAAGIILAGALIVAVLMNTPRPKPPAEGTTGPAGAQDAQSTGLLPAHS